MRDPHLNQGLDFDKSQLLVMYYYLWDLLLLSVLPANRRLCLGFTLLPLFLDMTGYCTICGRLGGKNLNPC